MLNIKAIMVVGEELQQESGFSADQFVTTIFEAIRIAYGDLAREHLEAIERKFPGRQHELIRIGLDEKQAEIRIFAAKTVVPRVVEETLEISLEYARGFLPDVASGDTIDVDVTPPALTFGAVAAQTAKQLLKRRLPSLSRASSLTSTSAVVKDALIADFLTCLNIEQLCLAAEHLFEERDLTSAMQCYEHALDLLPDHKGRWAAAEWIYCGLGDVYFELRDYSAAIEYFQKIMHMPELLVDKAFVHMRLGQCYLETGALPRSEVEFSRAVAAAGEVILLGEDEKYLQFFKSVQEAEKVSSGARSNRKSDKSGAQSAGAVLARVGHYDLPEIDHSAMGAFSDSIQELTNRLVCRGFTTRAEIKEAVLRCAEAYTRDDLAPVDLQPLVDVCVERSIDEHMTAQARWPEATDCDRVDAAFESLQKEGIITRQNFSCCLSCGHKEMEYEMDLFRSVSGKPPKGYAFYHLQDTEYAAEGNGLYISFGSSRGSEHDNSEIAQQVVRSLASAGLQSQWDGNPKKRIQIHNFDWKRRWSG